MATLPRLYSLPCWPRRSLPMVRAVEVEAQVEADLPLAAQVLGRPARVQRVVLLQEVPARQAPRALDPREQVRKRSVAFLAARPTLVAITIPSMIQAVQGMQARFPPLPERTALEQRIRLDPTATRQQVPALKRLALH